MNEYQILDNAINKAKGRGWKIPKHLSDITDYMDVKTFHERKLYYAIIFDHSFCKALWPNDADGSVYWRRNMERMVNSNKPLEFLRESLK